MNKLLDLRITLDTLNNDLFDLLSKRKKLVSKIQQAKEIPGSLDHLRELTLFKTNSEKLYLLSELELLAFSLIMENHAGDNYPAWSKGEHLENSSRDVIEMINPFLIASLGKLSIIEKQLKPLYLKMIKDFNG